ncbi:MAG TPA: hypothetical protein VET69_14250 [Terriglobales bacterium]|nr:hypothetical protein [Terriglobales bacterium]
MRADKVEVSWDAAKSQWLVRIQAGEEVLRRHCDLPQNAGEQALRQAARDTLKDEGYEPDGATITVQQPRVA